MWQFTREIKIRMESLWMSFAVVLVLVATEVNAASLSSGFSSSVLPGISTSSLYPSIQNVTSSTKGGFSTVGISSKYAQLPSNTTSSLPSISTKTETSMLSISETRTLISHRTTIPLESSQSLTASQTSIEAVMNSVSSNYFVNSSSASSSSFNLNSSSAVILSEVRISSSTSQPLQTSEMSSSMQQSSMSTNMSYLSSVVSVAASQSGFVSTTRTLSLTQLSPTVAKATSSQRQLSHAMTINGSSTGLSSQSIAGSSTPQLENSRMAPSSSVAMATNRTLATGHLTSSVLVDASESPSTIGMSSTISASTNSTFPSKSKLFSMNDTVVVTSATIVNSSAHPVNATLMTTVLTSKATISPSPVVNFTLQSSTLSSSVGLGVNQTRGVADSSALSPSRSVPSLNQTVSVVKTSDFLSSSSVPLQASPVATSSSVVVEVKSSMVTAVGATSQSSSTSVPSPVGVVSSSVVSKNATMQSSTGVSLHRSTVASSSGTYSTGVVSLLPTASGEKSSPVSSTVAVSSSLLASLVATSSSVKVRVTSSIATAAGESSSSMPSVVSSRLGFSQNITSQSSSYARLTSKTVTPSSSSAETRMSRAASVTPNRTSTDEGLIVTSYSTPCYIYYVVEKTVLPVATANHSAVSPTSTTPKITLDIGSASSMHSGFPSVTLTHTVAMTTRVSELQSQVVSSTDLLTSSTGLVGVSANSSEMMPSSTSTHLMSTALVSTSETVSKVMVSHTSKVVQTEILTATSVTPSGTSSIFSDRRNTSDASTFKTLVQSQPGTLAIPRVTTSVVELTNKTLVASPMTSSSSFTPIVASASVSEMQNVSTALVTGTSSSIKYESLQFSHRSSPVASRSSDESRSFVPTVAPSLPSQGISSAGSVSAASQIISSNRATVTGELVLPSKSGSIAQTTASSKTPTIAISETSIERQTASRHTITTEASDVLVMKTTTLAPMPSPTTSRLLLSVAANETATSSISSPSVLLSSIATVSENRTFTTVSSKASIPVESVEHSQNSSLVQSSTMASVDPSASSVEVLSSSHIHASPSASLVITTLSESKVSSMSTEIKSSPEVASSSLQLTADNKTTTSNIEMSPSSSSIHPSSNVSSSVVEPRSSAMLSQAGTTSIPTSSSNQVAAASSSLSQSGNKTSAYNTQMFPQSSMMLSLFASISQAGATSVPANSSPQVATSSSVSQANSTSSPAEHLPSSSSPLETSSSISSSKRRRKKRAIGHTNSTTLGVHSSSSVVVTSLSGEPVASTSQGVSAVPSVVPSAHTASQTLQISNSVMLSVEGGSSQGLLPTSVLTLSGQSQIVSEPPPSPSVSVSSSLSTQAASFSGDFTLTAALPASSPSASSVSIQKPTGNTTSGSSAILMATGSASSGVSPSLHVNVTESHTGSVAQSPSSATVHVTLTPSGTFTQSRGVLVSSSTESLVPQVSETVGSMTTHANLSVTNVVGTMASSSSGVVPSIHVSREQSSSLGVAISSILVDNHTSPTSVSLGSSSSSRTQQSRESSITISSSPQPTIIKNVTSTVSSSPSSFSVMLSALQSSSEMTSLPSPSSPSQLSSPTTDPASQAVSSSVLTRPSPSAVQSSEIQETVAASSSVTIASSSRVYRPPLVTISSLGICYVVYTTRIVQPSLVSTLPVSMSSTVSVNATSTPGFSVFTHSANATSIQLSPSLSLNTSSAVVQTTLDVNATSSQSPQVVSTAVSVNVTVKPSGSSSRVVISTTMHPVNSTSSRPALTSSSLKARTSEVTQSANVSQSRAQKSSTSSSTIPSSSVAFTAAHSIKETSLPTSTHLLSTQVFTSQVISPTRTVSQVVSSSATAPPTQPPDRSLLIEAIFNVPQNTDIQSKAFKEDLEVRLADAYRFVELTSRRRRRATPEINATIDSIQRVNNAGDVNVTFFITKDGQRVPASDAAQNYEKLSKAQLGSLVKLDVVSMPQPLVVPTTPPLPSNILVSLIIQDSASNNISIAENRNRLENNLAAYYNEQKQLTTAKATIKTILHEPNEIVYLEFYITVDGQAVNASVVVETFKVPHVNLLTAKLGVQVLVQVYIPDSLTANEADYVIIGVSVPENQDLTNASFRSDLANKLVTLYQTAKGKKNRRRKKRSGSTSATIKDIVRNPDSTASEADVTFFVFDAGKVVNASYVVTVMNRLSTNEMTTVTRPYAVLSAPRRAIVPTSSTEITPTVAPTEIKWWIIPAVLCPILLIIVIILLICWRWKKGAPKSKVEPDTIRMLDTNKRKPVQGFDVARYTEPGVSGMKETSFMSRSPPSIADDEEAAVKPARRETSLRRKVQKRPIQKPPVREQRQTNPAYEEEEEEEEEDESVVSVTPPGSTEALTRVRAPAAKPPSASRKTAAKPQRPVEPSESEQDSELSEDVSESEPESVPQPQQTRHSAAQVPTVAVMSEASGPPRYPPVRFRSSVHPAPSLPPLDAKQTSLVGVKVEPPSEDDSTRGQRKKKVTKRELEQRADLERQKNKQRLRDRKRNASYSPGSAVPRERKAWDRAQYDFDDVLGDEDAERVITGKKRKPRRRRPPSSSVATDEEGVPHLKSYRKLKSPKTTSSTTSTRDRGKKHAKSADSASNASSDESEIDMNETRRRMHAMLDDAFSLFGPQLSKKLGKEPEGQPAAHPEAHPEAHPGTYPATPARPAVIPRYIGGQPALPEPPPAHGRATEPTPRQRRRVQPTMPGYPAGMPQTYIGMPGYPGHPPARPVVTRDPIVVWDPADRQRILNQQAPPPTYPYRDPSGQNVYITPVQQQRDDMGGLVWSPYAAEDSMDALYPDLAQASYPGALSTSPPKDTSFLSRLQAAPPHDTVLNMSAGNTLDQRGASLGQSPQPLIKSIKDELFRLSQGASRKTPITEL